MGARIAYFVKIDKSNQCPRSSKRAIWLAVQCVKIGSQVFERGGRVLAALVQPQMKWSQWNFAHMFGGCWNANGRQTILFDHPDDGVTFHTEVASNGADRIKHGVFGYEKVGKTH